MPILQRRAAVPPVMRDVSGSLLRRDLEGHRSGRRARRRSESVSAVLVMIRQVSRVDAMPSA